MVTRCRTCPELLEPVEQFRDEAHVLGWFTCYRCGDEFVVITRRPRGRTVTTVKVRPDLL